LNLDSYSWYQFDFVWKNKEKVKYLDLTYVKDMLGLLIMRVQVIEPLQGYSPLVGTWLWAFENSRQRTLRALEGLHPDLLEWIPSWQGNTLSTLLYHLAAIEVDWLFTDILEEDEFPPSIEMLFPYDVRQQNGTLTIVERESLHAHLSRLAAVREYFLKSLQDMSEDEFLRVRSFTDYQVTPQWTIHHLMQHEAEHRGQIMTIREAGEYS
jgi:uncharacterized damage-inducible protein DinB